MGYYKYVGNAYRGIGKNVKTNKVLNELLQKRKREWREGPSVLRVDKPTRIDQARGYGYKSKQGFVVARVRIRAGGMRKSRPRTGRRAKRMGVLKITPRKSIQRIAEERAQVRFPNLEVLGSYWLLEDGKHKWYEVVLVDKHHPAIISDLDVRWITEKQHEKRVLRGLTPAGKEGRGLTRRGTGAERVRPGIRAKGRKAK